MILKIYGPGSVNQNIWMWDNIREINYEELPPDATDLMEADCICNVQSEKKTNFWYAKFWRDVDSAPFTVLFNTVGYLLNDKGETIEVLRFKKGIGV